MFLVREPASKSDSYEWCIGPAQKTLRSFDPKAQEILVRGDARGRAKLAREVARAEACDTRDSWEVN
jgi:hypothetical protein